MGTLAGGPHLDARRTRRFGVGFVSLTEALDLTTPTGRAMAGRLAVFAEFERDILRERVKAGIAQARAEGKTHGRPRTASLLRDQVEEMYEAGMSKSEIARRLSIDRTSVRRMLEDDGGSQPANSEIVEAEESGR